MLGGEYTKAVEMAHIIADKRKMSRRINRIIGQLKAIRESLEKQGDAECFRVLQQLAAVKGALGGMTQA
jgi:DNA-binding FrmR family transcriptional regulator